VNKRKYLILFFLFLWGNSLFSTNYAILKDIRYFSYKDYTRVVLDLSKPIQYKEKELKEKRRVRFFLDLKNTILSKKLKEKKRIVFRKDYIREIRIGQFKKNIARVVLEFKEVKEKKHFALKQPYRIVIDIYGTHDENGRINGSKKTIKSGKKIINKKTGKTSISKPIKKGTAKLDGDKKYSMARQLALTVKRIVIDPGHGGKDPGTIGKYYKTKEKTVVLDIAKRLEYYIKRYTKIRVYMTRKTDVFIPLEERTAFANSKHADLFISIHANSAKNRKAYGLETFWLNFTTDSHSIMVAAKENASSSRSIWELKGLLKKITLTSKLIESRIFAQKVQYSTLYYLRRYYRYPDYKVRKAPFYVLIGASMPSILVETGFLSNKTNERLLRMPSFRNRIAYGIFLGVQRYIKSLNGK
jgi:N-acetylmuramoyl-L-alanine amidase